MQYTRVPDLTRRDQKIHDLEEDTMYTVYVMAVTKAGLGMRYRLETRTKVTSRKLYCATSDLTPPLELS